MSIFYEDAIKDPFKSQKYSYRFTFSVYFKTMGDGPTTQISAHFFTLLLLN